MRCLSLPHPMDSTSATCSAPRDGQAGGESLPLLGGGRSATRDARMQDTSGPRKQCRLPGKVIALLAVVAAMVAGATTAGVLLRKNRPSTWSAVGSGFNSRVFALAVHDNALYAGGYFTAADPTTVNYIARWSGRAWSPLGTGVDSTVEALVVYQNALYAGGWFAKAGGVTANRIARWSGTAWSPLGTGVGDTVAALAVYDDALYVGGDFRTAGGMTVNHIARWNGVAWSALGTGGQRRQCPVRVYVGGVRQCAVCGRSLHDGRRRECPQRFALGRHILVDGRQQHCVVLGCLRECAV